jgi:hypothetical protein
MRRTSPGPAAEVVGCEIRDGGGHDPSFDMYETAFLVGQPGIRERGDIIDVVQ